ncbi:MAG: metallophosphoesterase, partial [Flavisolibacter sp.]|nr:metallophosphoesterase [Flavisolibacter sp.]
MKKVSGIVVLFLCLVHSSCRIARNPGDDGKIEVVFLQVNDVYEIAPLSDGKEGGVARIATLKKQYLAQHPNTFLVMAGDFLSPSIFHSLQYQGSLVRGKQMVESLNAAGLDIATFGNHEFDIREAELQSRLDESLFKWVSSNTHHIKEGRVWPFTQKGVVVPRTYIMNLVDADGTNARIGLISLTLPFNRADYVHYFDPLATAKEMYAVLKDSVDVVIALTHQSIESDIELARAIPDLAIIMGGHEHDNRFVKEGNVYITKAHANAKS